MTPSEMNDLITIQERLFEEWNEGCANGRVFLTPKLVRNIYEFYGYLRKTYEQQPVASVLVPDPDCGAVEHGRLRREFGECA